MAADLGWIKRAQACGMSDEDIQAYIDLASGEGAAVPDMAPALCVMPPRDDKAEKKKAYDRAYQAARRRRKLDDNRTISDDNRTTSYDIVDGSPPLDGPPSPPLVLSPSPPPIIPPTPKPTGAKQGSRLPLDFYPSQETCDWVSKETGWDEATFDQELDEFRDYWHSLPGAKATKLDWDKTFKNRVRAVMKRRGNGHAANGNGSKVFQPRPGERFVTSSGKVF